MTPVRLVRARTALDAARLLQAHAPHAQPIAAGGDLLGLWKEAVLDPGSGTPLWVDLASAPELARIEPTVEGGWRLGAMATLQQLQRTAALAPALVDALARIASPQLRVRTTLGGNLLQRPRCWVFRHPDIGCFKKGGRGCPALGAPAPAHPGAIVDGGPCHAAHPSDLATVLLALDARLEIVGMQGVRTLPMAELYRGAAANPTRESQLHADEVLCAVHVPPQPASQAFHKLAPRAANEFAAAAAAVVVQLHDGRIRSARIALGGVAPAPLLCAQADALVQGAAPEAVDVAEVARRLTAWTPASDAMDARIAWCRLAIERALAAALARSPA